MRDGQGLQHSAYKQPVLTGRADQLLSVQGRHGLRRKRRHAATQEIIIYLIFQFLQQSPCCSCIPVKRMRSRHERSSPSLFCLQGSEERIDALGIDSCFPAGILFASHGIQRGPDESIQPFREIGMHGEDAVAVIKESIGNRRSLLDVRFADACGILPAEILQHVERCSMHFSALSAVLTYGLERKGFRAGNDLCGIGDARAEPVHGVEHFGNAYPPVLVCVQKLKHTGIEFQT